MKIKIQNPPIHIISIFIRLAVHHRHWSTTKCSKLKKILKKIWKTILFYHYIWRYICKYILFLAKYKGKAFRRDSKTKQNQCLLCFHWFLFLFWWFDHINSSPFNVIEWWLDCFAFDVHCFIFQINISIVFFFVSRLIMVIVFVLFFATLFLCMMMIIIIIKILKCQNFTFFCFLLFDVDLFHPNFDWCHHIACLMMMMTSKLP